MTRNTRRTNGKADGIRAFFRSQTAARLLICLVGTAVLIALFEAAIVPMRYDLQVGSVPQSTIAASKDVVDEMTTEEKRDEAAAQVTPTYRYQEGVTETAMADFDQIFAQLRAVRQYGETLGSADATRTYTQEELQYAQDMLTLIDLKDYQVTTLLRCSREELEEAYTLLEAALQSAMQAHVTQGQEATAAYNIRQIVNYRVSISLGQNIVPAVLSAVIQPNMVVDQEATEAARQAARDAVEPVVYKQGQNIVVRGEGRITASQLAMLSSLGLLSGSGVDMSIYLGSALLVVMIVGIMLILLHWETRSGILKESTRLMILFVVMALSLALSMLVRLVNPYLAPTLLCALLMTALLGMRSGVICGASLTVLVAALAAGGSEVYAEKMTVLIISGLLSGTAAAMLLHRKGSRVWVLLAGLLGCLTDFLSIMCLGLMTASELTGTLNNALWRMGGSLLSTLLCIAVQPLLEMLFNLPTQMKLLELSNPNQPLLKRLLLEAPGTYHHCTIVANLAESAAEAVGANPLLARVGGYYHDIGKLKRPSFFAENQQSGDNAHDHTNPYVSAAIVTSHTRDGVALAKEYRLPQAVQTIIAEHHGNTATMYFYHKALQQADGKPVDINAFRYDGDPPRTKEGAIVMLCDTIEAAVRTMKNPTPEGMEEFIVKLVRGKLEDGQLSDCPLTLRDIDKICAAAATVLVGVFHERIEYPDADEDKNQAEPQEDRENEPAEASGEAEDGKDDPPPIVQDQVAVVKPEIPTLVTEVTPPSAGKPVEIDQLVEIEPLPTLADEQARQETRDGAETDAGEARP